MGKQPRILVNRAAVQADANGRLPGERVEGVVKEVSDGDLIVTLGDNEEALIDGAEWSPESPPAVGEKIEATYLQFDPQMDSAILTRREPRREFKLADLEVGDLVAGRITEVNKGGLVMGLGRIRGFMPTSQIARKKTHDLGRYLAKPLVGEVTQINPKKREILISLRTILDRWEQKANDRKMLRFERGQVMEGVVVRRNEHGAFIDLGGIDGLLHENKIEDFVNAHENPEEAPDIQPGTTVEVLLVHVDRERGRIGLDFNQQIQRPQPAGAPAAASSRPPATSIGGYEVGDEFMAMVRTVERNGARVRLEERLEGWLPATEFPDDEPPRNGAVLRFVVTSIEPRARRIELAIPGNETSDEESETAETETEA